MSTDDTIFLGTREPLEEVAAWLRGVLGLERIDDAELGEGKHLLRGRARTVDGELIFLVEPNVYGEVDPEPDDVSAIDHYPGVVDIRYAGKKDEELQMREARAVFGELVGDQPDAAMILSHNMALLTAAYLPGVGVRYFDAGTTLDAPDRDAWQPWVVT
jgi:hypothetical protein